MLAQHLIPADYLAAYRRNPLDPVNSGNSEMRQNQNASTGLCVPPQPPCVRYPNARTRFLVLLLTAHRRIAWFEVTSNQAPDSSLLAAVAERFDRLPLYPERAAEQARSTLQFDLSIQLRDGDIFEKPVWRLNEWLQAALIAEVSSRESDAGLMEFRGKLEQEIHEFFDQELEDIKCQLDTDVLHVASPNGKFSLNLYNFVMEGTGELRRNRMQALQAYPFLAERLLSDNFRKIREAIDHGDPLTPALAQHFNVPEYLVRRIGKRSTRALSGRQGQPERLWPLLAEIAVEKIPKTEGGWIEFEQLCRCIQTVTQQPINLGLSKAFLAECLYSPASAKALQSDEWQLHQIAVRDFLHCIGSIARFLMLGRNSAREIEMRSGQVEGEVLRRFGLNRTVKLAELWTDAYQQIAAAEGRAHVEFGGGRWPVILEESVVVDGYSFTALDTPSKLRREGTAMKHCVGSYALACSRGQCQIWAIRAQTGRRSATLQTSVSALPVRGVFKLTIAQLRGPSNATVPSEVQIAVQKFVESFDRQPQAIERYVSWTRKAVALPKGAHLDQAMLVTSVKALKQVLAGIVDVEKLYVDLIGITDGSALLRQ